LANLGIAAADIELQKLEFATANINLQYRPKY